MEALLDGTIKRGYNKERVGVFAKNAYIGGDVKK